MKACNNNRSLNYRNQGDVQGWVCSNSVLTVPIAVGVRNCIVRTACGHDECIATFVNKGWRFLCSSVPLLGILKLPAAI